MLQTLAGKKKIISISAAKVLSWMLSNQFCKSKQLESHFDQMSSKHKIAFDLSKPETESRDRKRDPILVDIFNLNQEFSIFSDYYADLNSLDILFAMKNVLSVLSLFINRNCIICISKKFSCSMNDFCKNVSCT